MGTAGLNHGLPDAAADGQFLVPLILGAGREEPAVLVLEWQFHRVADDRRWRTARLVDGRRADAAPVRPFHRAEQGQLRIDALANAERDDVGQVERGVDRAGCRSPARSEEPPWR